MLPDWAYPAIAITAVLIAVIAVAAFESRDLTRFDEPRDDLDDHRDRRAS